MGNKPSCWEKDANGGIGCGKHYAATYISSIGKILLGLPKGFCRVGNLEGEFRPTIFETFDSSDWGNYDMWNVPVWKHLTKEGHTLVRGISPRINSPFIHIYLENCLDKINCQEITETTIHNMD